MKWKKWKGALLIPLACALAACLALTGCGGGGSTSDGSSSNTSATSSNVSTYAGYWQIDSMSVDGEEISSDNIQTLRELGGTGSNFILYLAEDGTGSYDAFGEVDDLTWDADKATVTTSSDNVTMDMSIEDGKLVLREDESSSATFTKGEDSLADQLASDSKAAEEEASGASIEDGTDTGATTQAIDPVTVADDDLCTITITEKAVDDWGDPGYTVSIQNKSDRRITVHIPVDVTAADGTMAELYGAATLLAGTKSTEFFYFMASDGVVTDLESLTNVQTTFAVYDADSYDDLASYTVTIP